MLFLFSLFDLQCHIHTLDQEVTLLLADYFFHGTHSSSLVLVDIFDITTLPSLLHPTTISSSPFITALQTFTASFTPTVIGCIDQIPSPLSLSLLSSLSFSSIQPEAEEVHLAVPVVDIENEIEIDLINSSSDSYIQSEDESSELNELPKQSLYESMLFPLE